MKRHEFLHLIICFAALWLPQRLAAQIQRGSNPAQSASLWLVRMNPAAMSLQPARLVIGSEILHAGFVANRALSLNEQKLQLAFPYWLPRDIAIGLDVRAFNALLYSEFEANLLVSTKIFSQFAIGMKVGRTSRAFERSQFTGVATDDPLLQRSSLRRDTPNFGAGFYAQAGAWRLGASVDHLNRPNLAYAGTALLPRHFAFGLAYDWGAIAPSVSWSDDGFSRALGIEITSQMVNRATLRLRYEHRGPVRLETQLHFQRNAKLAYGLTFPSGVVGDAASGSHELTYEHVLAREPESGAPTLVLSTNQMSLTRVQYQCIGAEGMNWAALRALPGMLAAYLDPTQQLGNGVVIVPGREVPQDFLEEREEAYRALSGAAAGLLRAENLHNVVIRVAPEANASARTLEKMLRAAMAGEQQRWRLGYQKAQALQVMPETQSLFANRGEPAPRLSHEKVVINIVVPNQRRNVDKWQLAILAPNGAAIKIYQGTRRLPATLEWDWRNASGELITAGQYRCKLNVQTRSGKKYNASAEIEVTLTRRRVSVRVTNGAELSAAESKK